MKFYFGYARVSTAESDHSSSPPTKPDAWTDLRPDGARDLAFELLAAAEHAEWLTDRAGYWERER